MRKRWIAWLLLVVLLVGMLPMQALASGHPEAAVDGSAVTAEGTDSFGTMLAQRIQLRQTETEQDDHAARICDIEMDGNVAVVSLSTNVDCTVVVAVYDEAGQQMLTSGKAEVAAASSVASVTIAGDLPEYYDLKGYIVDSESLWPLSAEYETPMYTRQMQELLAMTTADFDADRVLNLDSDPNNNFAVYADGVKILREGGLHNILVEEDEEGGHYRFEEADENLTGLQAGDILAYEKSDGNVLIIKVKALDISGTSVGIDADQTEMEEVFDVVKIDTTAGMDQVQVDNSDLPEGITYDGLEQEDGTQANGPATRAYENEFASGISTKYTLASVKFGSGKLTATVSGSVKLAFQIKMKFYLAMTEASYFSAEFEYSAALNLSCSGSFSQSLAKLGQLTFSPVAGVYIRFTPSIVLQASATLSYIIKYKGSYGVKATFSPLQPLRTEDISKDPKLTQKVTLDGTIFVGLSLEPDVVVITQKVAKVGMNGQAGLEIYGQYNGNDLETHECAACIDGEIYIVVRLSADLSFWNHWKNELTLVDAKSKLRDFYYSVDYNEFGWGDCPHGGGGTGDGSDPFADEGVNNGKLGYDVYWELSGGILRIYGTGNTDRVITASQMPWHDLKHTIRSVIVEDGVTALRYDYMFSSCKNLTHVAIADSVTRLADGMFSGCTALTNVRLPSGLTYLDWNIFQRCTALRSISLPRNLVEIAPYAFRESGLKSISFPGGLKTIGDAAFEFCPNLGDVTLPANLSTFNSSIFDGCEKMTAVNVVPENPYFISHEGVVYKRGDTTVYGAVLFFPTGKSGSYTFPDGLTELDDFLQYLDSLWFDKPLQFTVPQSVSYVGSGTFGQCYNLSVTFLGDVPEFHFNAFYRSELTCYYPADNPTWTADVLQNYGASEISWVPMTSGSALAPQTRAADAAQTAECTNLQPDADYLFAVMLRKDTTDPLAAENLLYIAQGTADESGALSFSFVPREDVASYETAFYGPQPQDPTDPPDQPDPPDPPVDDWENPFVDVQAGKWYFDGVRFACRSGLFSGITKTEFRPNQPMTRGMLVTVLWRLDGKPDASGYPNPFSDVPSGKYFTSAVRWAAGNGVVNGISAGKFVPDGNITREQMAAILYRYAGMKGYDTAARTDLNTYPDYDKVSNYAKTPLSWANAEGLITGDKQNGVVVLNPSGNATRAQVAVIFMRYAENVVS